MSIRVLAFDFDNTLVDSLPLMRDAVNAVLASLPTETIECQIDELEVRTPYQLIMARGGDQGTVKRYWTEFRSRLPILKLFPGVRELLERADERLPLCLQSSLSRSILIRCLRTLGIDKRFSRVIAHGDVPNPKPAPDGLLAIANFASVPPAQILFVGDRVEDIRAAKAAAAISGLALWSRGDHRRAMELSPTYSFLEPHEIWAVI